MSLLWWSSWLCVHCFIVLWKCINRCQDAIWLVFNTWFTPSIYWHQAETASCCWSSWYNRWLCVYMSLFTSPSWWVLSRDSELMNWVDSSVCAGLLSFVNPCGILSLNPTPWLPPPLLLPSTLVFWLLPFYWPPICLLAFWFLNPVIFILWSLRGLLGRWACVQAHTHTQWWEGVKA